MRTDKVVETPARKEQEEQIITQTNRAARVIIVFVALCTCAFVFCFLFSVGVLHYINQQENLLPPHVPFGDHLTTPGLKLLQEIGLLSQNILHLGGSNIVFTIITGIECAIYIVVALLIRRLSGRQELRLSLLFMWLGVIIAGCILLVTPALISRDLFVYAGYGRSLVAHHVNPYFVAPAKFPQDPITPWDDWRNTTAAYGPLWLVVCALVSLVGGSNLTGYIVLFRLLALAVHLVNALLVMGILRTMGRSPRTIVTGTLLYAWNPLLILESCLSAHNDLFMIMFLLLGILFCVKAQQQNFSRPLYYVLPGIAFTLAALVKFTALPIIFLYIVLLARKTLYSTDGASAYPRLQWGKAILKVVVTTVTVGLVGLVFYGPFFIGHSITAIINSFTAPPSSSQAVHSMLSIIVEWGAKYGKPTPGSWWYLPVQALSDRHVWNEINIAVVLVALLIGVIWLWRKPETRTLIFASIMILGGLLIVTTWFFPWYVTWLVGLAVVAMPTGQERVGRTLFAFALTFSITARLLYLFIGNAPLPNWDAIGYASAVVPPLLIFLIVLIFDVKLPAQTKPLQERIPIEKDSILKS